ncbi:hypothetical protein FN846DRAFT_750787, partial [Sphaerosporella brunnea]
QLVEKEDEYVIVRDSKTGDIVLMVIRNFCADSAILEWASNIVGTGVQIRKSVRLDDPGIFSLIGYTPASSNCPSIMWAQNLLCKKTIIDSL